MTRAAVVGAGSWGTAIALVLAAGGTQVTLWSHDARHAARMEAERENARYLPGVALTAGITVRCLDEAAAAPDVLVLAVPSAVFRAVAQQLAARWPDVGLLVSLTKGFDPATGERLSHVLRGSFPPATARRLVVLAGPSHAEEVVRGVPTAVVAASHDAEAAEETQRLFTRPSFRVYTNSDVAGVEIAVAVKNVIAIAAGLGDGLGLGDNSKGALLTRGLAEMTRIGVAMGGRRETFFGLAGLGDLVTTCTSRHSRNRALGELVARGASLEDALVQIGQVVEGVPTTRTVRGLAAAHGVEMPIAEQVHAVLFDGCSARDAMGALMSRDPRAEEEAHA